MLAVLTIALCLTSFSALALSMARHHRDVFGGTMMSSRRTILRIAGWALLALSLWPCLIVWGASIGIVAWFGVSTVAALAVAMCLTYARPVSRGAIIVRKGQPQ